MTLWPSCVHGFLPLERAHSSTKTEETKKNVGNFLFYLCFSFYINVFDMKAILWMTICLGLGLMSTTWLSHETVIEILMMDLPNSRLCDNNGSERRKQAFFPMIKLVDPFCSIALGTNEKMCRVCRATGKRAVVSRLRLTCGGICLPSSPKDLFPFFSFIIMDSIQGVYTHSKKQTFRD